MEQVREVEHKFHVPEGYEIPDLADGEGVGHIADVGVVDLAATYYDTMDLRLAREGITLRRRAGGDDEGWHLKLPTTRAGVRDELHSPLSSSDDPPATLSDIVSVLSRDQALRPLSTVRTHRHRRIVHNAVGVPVAELADDRVTAGAPHGDATTEFRELELELVSDDPAVAGVIEALTNSGATEGAFVSKAVRALGPGAMTEPEVPEPPRLQPADPAADHVAAYLARYVRTLRWHDIGFRRDPRASEHVHQMRVSARRLRSGLRVFAPLLDVEVSSPRLAGELRWFARGLSELREAEVLLPRLLDDATKVNGGDAERVADAIRDRLGTTLNRALQAAIEHVATERYFTMHDRLVVAATTPPATGAAAAPAHDVLPGLARDAWNRLQAATRQLTPDSPNDRWHAVRLAAKRARYAGEAVAQALGPDSRDHVARMKNLTTILGEHQDAVQAAAWARSLSSDTAGDTALASALDTIARLEGRNVLAARERFRTAWQEVSNGGSM